MRMPFAGGCGCGAVRYECRAEPEIIANCYCRDCQIATGGACATVVVVPSAALVVTRGEAARYEVRAESGNPVHRCFCRDCGTPLFAGSLGHPETQGVYVASLDDPTWPRPALNLWTCSRQPWALIDASLPALERGRSHS